MSRKPSPRVPEVVAGAGNDGSGEAVVIPAGGDGVAGGSG